MKLVKISTHKVTKSLADGWTMMDPCPSDRPINKRRLDALTEDILGGRAIAFQWALGVVDGRRFRVNGKHSSTAISSLVTVPKGLMATVQEYECESMEDLAILYSQFDAKINSRTQRDVNRTVQASGDLSDVRIKIFDLAVMGIYAAEKGWWWSHNVSPDSKALTAAANAGFVMFLDSIITTHDSARLLSKTAVASAMFLTWNKCQKDALLFWKEVRDGTGPAGCATRILQIYLLSARSGKYSRTGRNSGTVEHMAVMEARCINAWNAWRSGTTLLQLKAVGSKRPVVK